MEKKYSLTLDNEFILYCKLNKIDDVEKLANEIFNRGFTILKYGEQPIKNTVDTVPKKIVEEIKKPSNKTSLYDE